MSRSVLSAHMSEVDLPVVVVQRQGVDPRVAGRDPEERDEGAVELGEVGLRVAVEVRDADDGICGHGRSAGCTELLNLN